MVSHPGTQLAQETAMQMFVDYTDQLVRAVALATVYRDNSVIPFEESYEPWTEVGQQMIRPLPFFWPNHQVPVASIFLIMLFNP